MATAVTRVGRGRSYEAGTVCQRGTSRAVWTTTNGKHCGLRDSIPTIPRSHCGDRPCPMGTLALHLSHRTRWTAVLALCPGHHVSAIDFIDRFNWLLLPDSVTHHTQCAW